MAHSIRSCGLSPDVLTPYLAGGKRRAAAQIYKLTELGREKYIRTTVRISELCTVCQKPVGGMHTMKKHEFMTRLADTAAWPLISLLRFAPQPASSRGRQGCSRASTAPERTAANPYYPASFECKATADIESQLLEKSIVPQQAARTASIRRVAWVLFATAKKSGST